MHQDHDRPAVGLAAISQMIEEALRDLAAGESYPDRCIAATATLVRLQQTFNRTIGDLEMTTSVPWGALMYPYIQAVKAKKGSKK